jgi:hypothetical protein
MYGPPPEMSQKMGRRRRDARWAIIDIDDIPAELTRVLHHGTCGSSLPIRDSHLCLQALNAVRLLQLVVYNLDEVHGALLAQPDFTHTSQSWYVRPCVARKMRDYSSVFMARVPQI